MRWLSLSRLLEIIDRVAPQFKSASAQESLARLSAALAEARTASESCKQLRHKASQRATTRNALAVHRQTAVILLDEACRRLGVESDALPASLARMATRHALECERVTLFSN